MAMMFFSQVGPTLVRGHVLCAAINLSQMWTYPMRRQEIISGFAKTNVVPVKALQDRSILCFAAASDLFDRVKEAGGFPQHARDYSGIPYGLLALAVQWLSRPEALAHRHFDHICKRAKELGEAFEQQQKLPQASFSSLRAPAQAEESEEDVGKTLGGKRAILGESMRRLTALESKFAASKPSGSERQTKPSDLFAATAACC